MIGHVPANEFAQLPRKDYFSTKVVYDEATIKETLRSHRMWLTYRFDRSNETEFNDDEGPTL